MSMSADEFWSWYSGLYGKIVKYLGSKGFSRALAEDAVQDAFIQAFRQLGTLEKPDAFQAWVWKIAHNRAKDLASREGRMCSLETTPGSRLSWTPDQKIVDLHRAAEQLSEKSQIVLSLLIAGFTAAEIAEQVNLTRKAVYQRIRRIKIQLKERVSPPKPKKKCNPKRNNKRNRR